jgi:signal transduction histidine kinase
MKDGAILRSTLVFVVVVAALLLICRLRLRGHLNRVQALMDYRVAERERAFVEMHDALLQDVQGMTLSLQAIADQLPPTEPARQRLEHALDQADELLARGRNRLKNARHVPDASD